MGLYSADKKFYLSDASSQLYRPLAYYLAKVGGRRGRRRGLEGSGLWQIQPPALALVAPACCLLGLDLQRLLHSRNPRTRPAAHDAAAAAPQPTDLGHHAVPDRGGLRVWLHRLRHGRAEARLRGHPQVRAHQHAHVPDRLSGKGDGALGSAAALPRRARARPFGRFGAQPRDGKAPSQKRPPPSCPDPPCRPGRRRPCKTRLLNPPPPRATPPQQLCRLPNRLTDRPLAPQNHQQPRPPGAPLLRRHRAQPGRGLHAVNPLDHHPAAALRLLRQLPRGGSAAFPFCLRWQEPGVCLAPPPCRNRKPQRIAT